MGDRVHRAVAALLVSVCASACSAPDPRAVLRLTDMEAHWAIDRARGQTQFLAPVVRFRLKNVGPERLRSIQANSSFRRDGEEDTWGSGFQYVATPAQPLEPGEERWVVMQSDARYSSSGPAEQMIENDAFKDVTAQVFLKVAASPPVDFGSMAVERRIGARSVQDLLPPDGPEIVLPPAHASPRGAP